MTYPLILYRPEECVTFCKTKETFGGLSNMAGGYPIQMGNLKVRTNEHLYQALRFPDHPDVQQDLLAIPSPLFAKKFGRKHIEKTRADWEDIKVDVLEWTITLKLLNNRERFTELLLSTGDKEIVEFSKDNDYWGAVPYNVVFLRGCNANGRLLWMHRRKIESKIEFSHVPKVNIPNFLFLGENAIALAKSGLDAININ